MRRLLVLAGVLLTAFFGIVSPAQAHHDMDVDLDFSTFHQWGMHVTNFEGGVRTPGERCGTDACASLEVSGADEFLRVAVHPSATPGYYTNTDISQMDLEESDLTDTGPYTATYGHPVTLTARIRWSANYDAAGQGPAVGTSGVVLWNSAFDSPGAGPNAEYDQIGFVWASDDALLGLIAGFTGATFVDQFPIAVAYPQQSVDINDWMDVEMVWSADQSGTQTVAYYVGADLMGQHTLPVPLQGLSLEIWTDNQEADLCPGGGLCITYPNPAQTQSLDVDHVVVTQP